MSKFNEQSENDEYIHLYEYLQQYLNEQQYVGKSMKEIH